MTRAITAVFVVVFVVIASSGCYNSSSSPAPVGGSNQGEPTGFTLPETELSDEQGKYLLKEHNFQEAWDVSTGVPTGGVGVVIVAVLDSGRLEHSELDGVYVDGGFDVINNDDDPFVTEEEVAFDNFFGFVFNHGTAVDSVIAAVADENGITGAAPDVRIRPYRVFTEDGFTTIEVIRDAILLAALDGCDVISMSFGLVDDERFAPLIWQDAIDFARSKGVILVAAAGNNGIILQDGIGHFPSSFEGVIGVGATELVELPGDQSILVRADFTNRGEGVDIFARGVSVLCAQSYRQGIEFVFDEETGFFFLETTLEFGDFIDPLDGTSFSCPLVSGVMGLAKAVNPNITSDQAAKLLASNSSSFEFDEDAKVLDAGKFLRAVQDANIPPIRPTVAVSPAVSSITRNQLVSPEANERRRLSLEDPNQRIRVMEPPVR